MSIPLNTLLKVLDIGNGGHTPGEVLGERTAGNVKLFVGIDNSIEMLARKEDRYARAAGDRFMLPFKDNAFDYVILSAIIHHLGLRAGEDHFERFERFIREALRVCSREIIVYAVLAPRYVEMLERAAARVMGCMPTFVLSEKTLATYLRKMQLARQELTTRSLSELTHPFCRHVLVMDYEWLRVPAFLFPLKNCFFVIPGT